jgi:putative ABC transport system permease protein
MSVVVSAWTVGLILALLALGIFLSFRVFRFADITVDGSFTLGAALSAVLLIHGWHPLLATMFAFVAGLMAGATTGVLHTKFKINPLLSGILVMTALFSVNLRVMGRSNVPLASAVTLQTYAEDLARWLAGGQMRVTIWAWEVPAADLAMLLLSFIICAGVGLVLYAFLRTELGTAMRATGDNDQMIRALGVNVDGMIIAGLALSNGLVALSGSLLAQTQSVADIGTGVGSIVWGLGSVIIGEALVGGMYQGLGLAIVGAIMGSVLFRLLVALVLRAGLNVSDQKAITAVFVFVALVLPDTITRVRSWWGRRVARSAAKAKAAD